MVKTIKIDYEERPQHEDEGYSHVFGSASRVVNYKLQAISVGQNLWFYILLITTGKAF
jgi:hypothetical protein